MFIRFSSKDVLSERHKGMACMRYEIYLQEAFLCQYTIHSIRPCKHDKYRPIMSLVYVFQHIPYLRQSRKEVLETATQDRGSGWGSVEPPMVSSVASQSDGQSDGRTVSKSD